MNKLYGEVGVSVKDLKTSDEISLNGDAVFQSASSIKVHILIEFFNQVMQRRIDPQGKFRIAGHLKTPGGES